MSGSDGEFGYAHAVSSGFSPVITKRTSHDPQKLGQESCLSGPITERGAAQKRNSKDRNVIRAGNTVLPPPVLSGHCGFVCAARRESKALLVNSC